MNNDFLPQKGNYRDLLAFQKAQLFGKSAYFNLNSIFNVSMISPIILLINILKKVTALLTR